MSPGRKARGCFHWRHPSETHQANEAGGCSDLHQGRRARGYGFPGTVGGLGRGPLTRPRHLQLLQPAQAAHGSRELLQLVVVQVPVGKTGGQGGRRQAGRAAWAWLRAAQGWAARLAASGRCRQHVGVPTCPSCSTSPVRGRPDQQTEPRGPSAMWAQGPTAPEPSLLEEFVCCLYYSVAL